MKRGEVWLVDFGQPSGPEQAGERPGIILQDDRFTDIYVTLIVVPVTSNLKRGEMPTTVFIPAGEAGLSKDSVVLCHQIQVRGKIRMKKYLGKLSPERLSEVEATVSDALGL